jgi:uncharacterized protein (TIGR03437 family)
MPFRTGFWTATRLVAIPLCLGVALNGNTGAFVPQLSAFDDFMNGLLEKWQIPGATLGVSRHGRLMLARGYGLAEAPSRSPLGRSASREAEELVQPDSLFRIAGISKTLTASAILRLVEDGRLSLDAKAFSVLTGFGVPADLRTNNATVRDLLGMTNKWGGDKTFDPSLESGIVSNALGRTTPVSCIDTIRYMLKLPLDRSPDPQYASNYEYCILGRIIEEASGQHYEDYVKSAVLLPLGITRMQIGHTTVAGRAPGEVRYYDFPGAPLVRSTTPNAGEIPRPYGAVSIEAIDAAGGWIASVSDLLRLVNALDGRRPPTFLKQASLPALMPHSGAPASVGAASYKGLAWVIPPRSEDADWWNYGASDGVSAYVFRQAATGVDAVLLFNSRPRESGAFDKDLSEGVIRTINSILNWPAHDLFATGPELFARDVVNAADYSGGGVVPGEIVVMFPSNAGPPEIAEWPTGSTGSTRVFFDNMAAPIVYTVAGQVSAIVPHEVSKKAATEVVIEYQGERSPPVTLPVISSAPALFTRDASGKGQAAMLNVTGCCNSARNPAMRGAIAYLFATGEGLSLTPEVTKFAAETPSAVPVPVPADVKVIVGGVPAKVLYAGDAGVLQINIRVPKNAPIGGAVPVVLMVGNSRSSNGVTMAVRTSALRILVVDHDASILRRLKKILQGAGYEVLTALESVQAGARVNEGPIDLVITDLAMPKEAAAKMIGTIQNENPQLKIMAMSGESTPNVLRAADILGAQAVLRKPLTEKMVLRRVHDILQAHFVAF